MNKEGRDYRTWWRKRDDLEALQVSAVMAFIDLPGMWLPDVASEIKPFNLDSWDCVLEQLWAIREDLA